MDKQTETPERIWIVPPEYKSHDLHFWFEKPPASGHKDFGKLVEYVRADTRTRSPLADEGAAVNARFNRVYASQQKARDTRLARKLLTGWGHEPVEGAIKEVAAALEAARSASTPPTLAHVEGCTKALSVPVDLCECGGTVITWPASTPAVGADDAETIEQIASKLADAIYWARNQPKDGLRDLLIQFAAEIKGVRLGHE